MRSLLRTHAPVALVAVGYGVLLALVAWWPQRVDSGLGVVGWPITGWLAAGTGTTREQVAFVAQVAANVVLFVPLGALAAAVARQRPVLSALVCGLGLSMVIEAVQAVALPERVASWGDVAANAGGAVLGALLIAALPDGRRGRRTYLSLVAAVVLAVLVVLIWGLATASPGQLSRSAMESHAVLESVETPPDAFAMTVTYVYDGDTIEAQVAHPNAVVTTNRPVRIRLIGVDAPEMTPQPQCWAQAATDWLRTTLPVGATIHVAPDHDSRDDYGRRLFNVWTGDRFVNLDLVRQGQARALRIWPNAAHADLIGAAQQQAAAQQRGLWRTCAAT